VILWRILAFIITFSELVKDFGIYYTPTHRVGAIFQSPCPSVRSHFRNRYLSFYWKKWFYIWYMALAGWLVPCLPFPGLPHIYFLFTVRLTNEWVGVFLARRGVQHLVITFSDLVKEFGIYYPLANELAKGYSNATFRNILVNTLESTSFNGFWPHLVHT
jgi:hypothetical protein